MDIASVIYPSGIQRLRVIPTGQRRESSFEFFTSFRMKQFLHAVRKRYPDRFVIIDAPSIEESPDSRILSELTDYTMLVVKRARETEAKIVNAVKSFDESKFIGIVIND
jgi:protein-tyrosine kinase